MATGKVKVSNATKITGLKRAGTSKVMTNKELASVFEEVALECYFVYGGMGIGAGTLSLVAAEAQKIRKAASIELKGIRFHRPESKQIVTLILENGKAKATDLLYKKRDEERAKLYSDSGTHKMVRK